MLVPRVAALCCQVPLFADDFRCLPSRRGTCLSGPPQSMVAEKGHPTSAYLTGPSSNYSAHARDCSTYSACVAV